MIEKIKPYLWFLPVILVLIMYFVVESRKGLYLKETGDSAVKENTTPEMRDLNLTR